MLRFLHESGFIPKDRPIIDLNGADLYQINLSHVNLRGANLSDANLSKTDLWRADFTTAIGGFEDLSIISSGENLVFDSADGGVMANLRGANLSDAILTNAKVTLEQLEKAKTLKHAIMPDGSIHQ